jgi:AcrR family transcriptional regulator
VDGGEQLGVAAGYGIGRATLYRYVGNRDDLLATVLAEATEQTYRKAIADADGTGAALILDVLRRVMEAVDGSRPLRALTSREPTVFIRLALMPGAIESASARMISDLLTDQHRAGQLELPLPADVLAEAIARIGDVHLYAPLLGGSAPETDTALEIIALLLRAP